MKTKNTFIVLLCACLFSSCATTKTIMPEEMGFKPEEVQGEFISVSTEGSFYVGEEKAFIAEEAEKRGYKYFIMLSEVTNSKITGVETTYNYHGNATTTINRKYYGKGTAYIFSSEDEKDEFLENNIPVYSVVNYSNGAIETRLGVGVLIGGICIFLLYLFMELY